MGASENGTFSGLNILSSFFILEKKKKFQNGKEGILEAHDSRLTFLIIEIKELKSEIFDLTAWMVGPGIRGFKPCHDTDEQLIRRTKGSSTLPKTLVKISYVSLNGETFQDDLGIKLHSSRKAVKV